MPGPARIKDELVIQMRMQDYMETVNQYTSTMCDSMKVHKDGTNLTETERAGLDEIKAGIRDKGWMIYTSDRVEKWSLTPRKISLSV